MPLYHKGYRGIFISIEYINLEVCMSTKFFRVIKASLRADQINWLKENFKTEMFMTDTYKTIETL